MSHSRGKFYVDKTVQGALAKRIVFHWCIFFLLSVISIFSLEYFLGDPNLTFGGHAYIVWQKYAFFVVLMVSIIPSFVYDSFKLSNRFAGPMVRLKNALKSAADGEQPEKIKFRDGDFWVEVSDEFNRLADRLDEQSTELNSAEAQ